MAKRNGSSDVSEDEGILASPVDGEASPAVDFLLVEDKAEASLEAQPEAAPELQLMTIEEHAKARGHVNTFDPARPPMFIDPSQQKAFILDMVKVHKGYGIGKLLTAAEYDAAVTEVMGLELSN